jgi:hypothetical protein
MGAVVARMALNDPIFQRKFKNKLHTFVSVAGPHLGSSGSDSALVGVGTWALMKWKKIRSLSQLSLEDDTMEKLAENSAALAMFKTVALVSSSSDTYVPTFSARIELPSTSGINPKVIKMQRALCENLQKVSTVSKVELDFQFDRESKTSRQRFDIMLGRASHVHVLDSIPLTMTLLLIFGKEWFA